MEDVKSTRRAPWPEKAKVLAMEKFLEHQETLTGKFKGCGAGGISFNEKESVWQKIADSVNAISDVPVTVGQVKKQITNIKQRANEKIDGSRKTGGGRAAIFTPSEKLWTEATSKKTSVHGLNISLDTEESVGEKQEEQQDLGANEKTADSSMPISNSGPSASATCSNTERPRVTDGHRKKTERDMEKENLYLDSKRIKLDTERIVKETIKLEKETTKIEKESEKIQKEIEIIKLKKSIFEIMLSRLAEDPLSVSLLDKFNFDF